MQIIENPYLLLALTIAIFYGVQQLNKRVKSILLHPVFITIILMIIILKTAGISYQTYNQGGQYIEFWLKPAIVALAIPLYKNFNSIVRNFIPILISQIAGSLAGVFSVVSIAKLMGATPEVIISLTPKSVTTPIAMEITNSIGEGGIPSLTAAVVVVTGLFGAIAGYKILQLSQIKTSKAQGISIGTSAHAIGTAISMEVSSQHGAYATLGLIINGILTSIFAPIILSLFGVI